MLKINKKKFLFLHFFLFFFSCKNQIIQKNLPEEDEPPLQLEGAISVCINVINEVNTDSFVAGTKLKIHNAETKQLLLEKITDGKSFNFDLEINKNYDFEIDGLDGRYAASAIRNLKIFPYTRKINIVQLSVQMPNRKLAPPVLSKFYFERYGGDSIDLAEKNSLTLPLNGKIIAEINSYGGSVMKIFNRGFGVKLGINSAPSSVIIKEVPILGGLSPDETGTVKKSGNGWAGSFAFKMFNHQMGNFNKADFIITAYDAAGNRLEHHTYIKFKNAKDYEKHSNGKIVFDNVLLKTQNSSSSINLFSGKKNNSHYFVYSSFEVKENDLHVPITAADLLRRKAGKENNFYKTASIVYNTSKIGTHIIADTFGGLDFSEEYEYKIRVYFENSSYADSKKIKTKILPPFKAELISPANNAVLSEPQEFSFKVSSVENFFSRDFADFFSFALKIKSWQGNEILLTAFKYYPGEKDSEDEALKIAFPNSQEGFVSLAELKQNGKIPKTKKSSDFISVDKGNGIITIKKEALLPIFNLRKNSSGYGKGMTYYWDICSYENDGSLSIFPSCFVKKSRQKNIETEFYSYANMPIFSAYTSNGNFSFSIDENSFSENSENLNSYIVKAPDNFDFSFLKELNAKVVDSIKPYDYVDELYYKIETFGNGSVDILSEILGTKGIISAERDYPVNPIEPVKSQSVIIPEQNEFTVNGLGIKPSDPILEQAGYSLEITQANKAYEEFGFGNNNIIVGIVDTGINKTHEDFIDEHGNVIFINAGTSNDISDSNGHGSHCSGIICARGENGKGIAGVSWKQTKIVPYRLSGYGAGGWEYYKALNHFAEYVKAEKIKGNITQDAVPFNMSLGSSIPSAFALEFINKALQEGILPIAASGNQGSFFVNYPAAYSGVLAVGSSNGMDKISQFSSKGHHVSIYAPGENIVSAGYETSDSYVSKSGTSMAAPFVTGAAAYLLTFDKTLTPTQIKTVFEQTADKIETDEEFNPPYTSGRINVYKAVKLVKENSIPKDKFFKGKVSIRLKEKRQNIPVLLYGKKGVCIAAALTTSEGKTEFRGLLPGEYTVKINGGKFYSKKFSILPGNDSDIEFEFGD